ELENREHCRFGPAHRGDDVAVSITRLREQPFAPSPKAGIGVLVELRLPFGEQVAGDSLHRVDALRYRTRTPFARLVRPVEPIVHFLEIAAFERDDASILIERRAKLLLRGILGVAGVLDAIDEGVALLDADGLERPVIRGRAARRTDREERHEEDAPERLLTSSHHCRESRNGICRLAINVPTMGRSEFGPPPAPGISLASGQR